MEQVRDCGVWSTWVVLERKRVYKTEAFANRLCQRVVGWSVASTAATALVLPKPVLGVDREGAPAGVREMFCTGA